MIFAVGLSEPDEALSDLVKLARGTLQGDARRDELSFARVESKLALRSAARRQRSRSAALLMAAVVVLAVGAFGLFRDPALTYQVVNGAVVDGDRIVGGKRTELKFSDGSAFSLEPGADARVTELNPHGGQVNLIGGAEVSIAKRSGASWTVAAGPYAVRVTGTSFEVNWSAEDQSFQISMKSGSVLVEGPQIDGAIALQRGQRLKAGSAGQRLVVEDLNAAKSAALPSPALEPEVAPPAPNPRAPASPEAATPARPELDWAKHVAQGKFSLVLEEAERRGLDRTLGSASLAELSALADAARYARRPAVARRVLLAERSRFAGTRAATEAAFFLGRIVEDEGGDATEWYDRYLKESGFGAYAAQALGRKMMLTFDQRGASAARGVAEDYLRRYPAGAYAAAAKKIIEERSEPRP